MGDNVDFLWGGAGRGGSQRGAGAGADFISSHCAVSAVEMN